MKVWTCKDHDGLWGVPVASVVVAETKEEARILLDYALFKCKLKGMKEHPYTLQELNINTAGVLVLSIGDY